MVSRLQIIRPDSRENKTTIQISREVKDILTKIGFKGESYNQIISRLLQENGGLNGLAMKTEIMPANSNTTNFGIAKSDSIIVTKYERVTISITDSTSSREILIHAPSNLTLEVSYNKPISKEDSLYQIDLKIERIIFDNEVYSPKEFFGVLQKDIVYCEEFVYYYFRSIEQMLKIEFNKSIFFFGGYKSYFELARWRTYLLNSKLSPEILSSDIERVFADLKNEKTNTKLKEDVENSYYQKIIQYGGINIL
jgi:hypothetical protein